MTSEGTLEEASIQGKPADYNINIEVSVNNVHAQTQPIHNANTAEALLCKGIAQ